MGDRGVQFSWSVIAVTLVLGLSISYAAVVLNTRDKSEYGPWLTVEEFEATEQLFSPGPLGYSIAVGVVRPDEMVGVSFYCVGGRGYALHATVDFKLIRIGDDGELISIVDQKSLELEEIPSYGIAWQVKLPDDAPAKYKFGVVIRDENRDVMGKLISILRVPIQKLNATMTLDKSEYTREEEHTLMITNYGPTQIVFGEAYKIEKLVNGKWVEVTTNEVWIMVANILSPGDSYRQSVKLTKFQSGDYRISKLVSAEGTIISEKLTVEFKIID